MGASIRLGSLPLIAMEVNHPALLADESGVDLSPHPKSLIGSYGKLSVGAAILVSVGFIGGRHNSAQSISLMDLQAKDILSHNAFNTEFGSWSDALTCPTLTAYISQITNAADAITPANNQASSFKTWYDGLTGTTDKEQAEATMNTKMTTVCTPTPTAPATKTSPASSPSSPTTVCGHISDYHTFGLAYSRATAGKPWAVIVHIDKFIRGEYLTTLSSEVTCLRSWYKNDATVHQRKDFEDNAVTHMFSAGMGHLQPVV